MWFSCFFANKQKCLCWYFFVYLFFKHIQILLRCYCPRLNRIRLRPDLCSGNHEHIFPFQQHDHLHHSKDNQRHPNSYCLFPNKIVKWDIIKKLLELTLVIKSVLVIQGCFRHWAAVARRAGSGCNIGNKNWLKPSAAISSHSYFSTRTFFNGHGFSFEMRLRVPSFLKKSTKWFYKIFTRYLGSILGFENRNHKYLCYMFHAWYTSLASYRLIRW